MSDERDAAYQATRPPGCRPEPEAAGGIRSGARTTCYPLQLAPENSRKFEMKNKTHTISESSFIPAIRGWQGLRPRRLSLSRRCRCYFRLFPYREGRGGPRKLVFPAVGNGAQTLGHLFFLTAVPSLGSLSKPGTPSRACNTLRAHCGRRFHGETHEIAAVLGVKLDISDFAANFPCVSQENSRRFET
jgi:hypothetical protein